MRGRILQRLAGRWQVGESETTGGGAGDAEFTLPFGGRERWYSVHRPPSADPREPLPLLLNFHGGFGNPDQQRHDTGMDALADAHGFMVVYPAGCGRLPRRWLTFNGGICCGYARMENIDDVGFTDAVLADVATRYAFDRTRIYATGFSNGAFMCYRLAFERPGLLAAIAPVSGVLGVDPVPGVDYPPLPVIHFHGLQDQNVAFAGGIGAKARDPLPRRSVEETLSIMRKRNRCPDTASSERRIGAARCRTYAPAEGGAPVELWTLDDGGHTWPGGNSSLPLDIVGPINMDIRASDLIWNFIKPHRLREISGNIV
ncbi:MAG TPA: PHB depolymerase family esterase [Kiritimatiellia bacterium]|nr:PHB depolymerase family esterase [Kiritimatiellia bacterium]